MFLLFNNIDEITLKSFCHYFEYYFLLLLNSLSRYYSRYSSHEQTIPPNIIVEFCREHFLIFGFDNDFSHIKQFVFSSSSQRYYPHKDIILINKLLKYHPETFLNIL